MCPLFHFQSYSLTNLLLSWQRCRGLGYCAALLPAGKRIRGGRPFRHGERNGVSHRQRDANAKRNFACHADAGTDCTDHTKTGKDNKGNGKAERDKKATAKPKVTKKPQNNADSSATVYITDTGKKYHRAGYRSLAKSKHAISRANAKARGYSPCRVCKP